MYAVHHWLSYTANISRCDLLAESSLRFPICEYLERHSKEDDKCDIEVPFSVLSDKRRKIDVVWNEGDVLNCLELKFVSENTSERSEKQRIFNDLCRLYIALQTQTTAKLNSPERRHCYFAICGDSNLFISKFQQCKEDPPIFGVDLLRQTNDKTKATGDVDNWFSFKEGDLKEVANVSYMIKHQKKNGGGETQTSYYEEFKNRYNDIIDNDELKKTIEQGMPHFYTKLIGYINTFSDNTQTSQSIAIWEVLTEKSNTANESIMDKNVIINHLQKMNSELEVIKERNNDVMQKIKDSEDAEENDDNQESKKCSTNGISELYRQ
jgi:hypothetical protein